jgi:hypothetical protein
MTRTLDRSTLASVHALGLPQRAAQVEEDELPAGDGNLLPEEAQVVRHPDGYYWLDEEGGREFGPFESVEAALADREAGDEVDLPACDALLEVESELGMAGWIDPDTGSLAEETCTRLEDH